MRRPIILSFVFAVAMFSSTAAFAADPTSVDQLSASAGAASVAITGTATFRDVPVDLGTDPAADATAPGTDLVKASISAPVNNQVRFRLDIADPIPQLSSNPFAVYLWPITVNGNNTGLHLHASRARVGVLPTDAHLRLVRIANDTITTVAQVTGTMANGSVEWNVPLSSLGATGGSVITSEGIIEVVAGISGVGTLTVQYDTMAADELAYTVPSRTVLVGIGPVGAPDSAIALNTQAGVTASTGAFSASVPRPAEAGEYKVVAKACFGPQSCGTGSTTFTA